MWTNNECNIQHSIEELDIGERPSNDKQLMPPPPPVPLKQESIEVDKLSGNDDGEPRKKLETPLAAMLPSKYENVDVTELFPDFRHGQVGVKF